MVLQGQRDAMRQQMEKEKRGRSNYVEGLEETNALEENLRLERELLSGKLRQKDILERALNRERATWQAQLIKQAKLNEVIRQKDQFEKELIRQRDEMSVSTFDMRNFVVTSHATR